MYLLQLDTKVINFNAAQQRESDSLVIQRPIAAKIRDAFPDCFSFFFSRQSPRLCLISVCGLPFDACDTIAVTVEAALGSLGSLGRGACWVEI